MPNSFPHDYAQTIFEEIRDRPYRGTTYPEKSQNCYFKGTELLSRLTTLGFAMRARIGEMQWEDAPVPTEIVKLLPKDSISTHFYPEIFIDEKWRILDPSWNKSFAQKYNLPYSKFGEDNESCFKITKLYDETEQAQYIKDWTEKESNDSSNDLFITAMNNWLEDVNPKE